MGIKNDLAIKREAKNPIEELAQQGGQPNTDHWTEEQELKQCVGEANVGYTCE